MLSPDSAEREAPERTRTTTADVTPLALQLTRTEGAFAVGVLGDREELVAERITDEE